MTEMLSTRVTTSSDLMSIALQAEREAIKRYTQLARMMREGDNSSAASLFERMVKEEEEHERLLLEWMEQEGISENPDIGPISWRDPNVSTVYNEEACDPYYSTPYRALAFAVHNEEIAFRFYTHVAADSSNALVREYAEILAREELGHAALLRAERRKAYHVEREQPAVEPVLDPEAIEDESDLLAAAITIDRKLISMMNSIAEYNNAVTELVNNIQQQVASYEQALAEREGVADVTISSPKDVSNITASGPDAAIKQLCADCDRSFAFYDAIVENADNEQVMLTAQSLASSALDRIGILKEQFAEHCTE